MKIFLKIKNRICFQDSCKDIKIDLIETDTLDWKLHIACEDSCFSWETVSTKSIFPSVVRGISIAISAVGNPPYESLVSLHVMNGNLDFVRIEFWSDVTKMKLWVLFDCSEQPVWKKLTQNIGSLVH